MSKSALGGKIPTTIITGFLGAGKTTLIQNILQNVQGKRIALIINEFGETGVDRDFLKGCGDETCSDDDMVELANGCICCTVADEFVPTMEQLLARDDRPDHIIIETSGLALPQPLVQAFNWPQISTQVTIDGVITLVDAAALAQGRFADDEKAVDAQRQQDELLDHETPLGELFEDQLVCADMIILTKTDLVDEGALAQVVRTVQKEKREATSIVRAANGEIDLSLILGLDLQSETDLAGRESHHEKHHGHEPHEHDDFDSIALNLGEFATKQDLTNKLSETIAAHDLLRVKGFAKLAGSAAALSVQAVGGRINTWFDPQVSAADLTGSSLVFIGFSPLDGAAITKALTV